MQINMFEKNSSRFFCDALYKDLEREQRYWDERMLYLPHCGAATDHKQAARFLLPDHLQLATAAAASSEAGERSQAGNKHDEGNNNVARWPVRSDYGLPEDLFVFSYLGPLACISPQVLDVWCSILKRVPNSCLWLVRPTSNSAPLDAAAAAADGGGGGGYGMDDGSVGGGSVGNGGGGGPKEDGGEALKSVEANLLAEALVRGVKADRFVFCDPPSGLAPDDFPWGNPSSSSGRDGSVDGRLGGSGGVDEAFGFSAGGSAAARRAEHLWRHRLSEVHLEPWGSGCAHGTSLGVADSLWAGTPAVALRGTGGAAQVATAVGAPATASASTAVGAGGASADQSMSNSGEVAAAASGAGVGAVAASGSEVGGAAGRAGAAALCAAGLSELAVANPWVYEETAVMLAVNDEKYMALRSQLESSRDELPLFDTAR